MTQPSLRTRHVDPKSIARALIRDDADRANSTGAIALADRAGPARAPRIVPDAVETPWPRMRPESCFGLAGDVVRALDPITEADPAAVLLTLLVAVGNALNRGPHVMAGGARHALTLFLVLVGVSSKGRKGTSLAVVRRLLRDVDAEWCSKNITTGLSSGEGLIWSVHDPVFAMKRVKQPDGTHAMEPQETEAGIADKRRLVVEQEFAGTLRVMGRDGSTLSAVIRQAWDGEALRSMTKNSPASATDAHLAIIGHVTADELRHELTDTEAANGFGNRFLFCCVRRSKFLPEGGELDLTVAGDLACRLRQAVDFGRRLGEIRRDDDARAKWADIYEDLSEGSPGLVGAVTARAEAQVTRLAALFAVLDCSKIVQVAHLDAALDVWRYCDESARAVFAGRTGRTLADKVLTLLQANGAMTRSEVRDAFDRHESSADLGSALQLLASAGLAHSRREETSGRPREIWSAT